MYIMCFEMIMCMWQGGPDRAEGGGLSIYIPRLGASDSWILLPVSQSIRSLGPLDNIHMILFRGVFFLKLYSLFFLIITCIIYILYITLSYYIIIWCLLYYIKYIYIIYVYNNIYIIFRLLITNIYH